MSRLAKPASRSTFTQRGTIKLGFEKREARSYAKSVHIAERDAHYHALGMAASNARNSESMFALAYGTELTPII